VQQTADGDGRGAWLALVEYFNKNTHGHRTVLKRKIDAFRIPRSSDEPMPLIHKLRLLFSEAAGVGLSYDDASRFGVLLSAVQIHDEYASLCSAVIADDAVTFEIFVQRVETHYQSYVLPRMNARARAGPVHANVADDNGHRPSNRAPSDTGDATANGAESYRHGRGRGRGGGGRRSFGRGNGRSGNGGRGGRRSGTPPAPTSYANVARTD
jgi:uncharacterized membrane protein YgcG